MIPTQNVSGEMHWLHMWLYIQLPFDHACSSFVFTIHNVFLLYTYYPVFCGIVSNRKSIPAPLVAPVVLLFYDTGTLYYSMTHVLCTISKNTLCIVKTKLEHAKGAMRSRNVRKVMVMVLNATFNTISFIWWWSVLLVEEAVLINIHQNSNIVTVLINIHHNPNINCTTESAVIIILIPSLFFYFFN
jgi:hypothetical protein